MSDNEAYRLQQSLNAHKQWERGDGVMATSSCHPPRHKESKYRKRVLQYDLDGNLVATHDSIHACADALGVCPMSVSNACNHYYDGRKCQGFILRFENDECLASGRQGSSAHPVIQMDIDWNVIAKYDSATEASKAFGRKSPCSILYACRGRQITAYGYRWKFA